jgi:hypothetical protein
VTALWREVTVSKKCFVIGPIGETGSTIRALADDFMEYIVSPCPALKELGYDKPIRADQLNEPGRITSQVIQLLMEAELVIADLTGNNANVYYELSFRHAIGKPVIHMAFQDTRLSFDVQDNRTIFYTLQCRDAENALEVLDKQIRRVSEAGYKPANPILETASIVQLQHSANPEQEVIGQILRMVQVMATQFESLRYEVRNIQAQQVANTNALAVATSTPHHLTGAGLGGLGGLGINASAVGTTSLTESVGILQKAMELTKRST